MKMTSGNSDYTAIYRGIRMQFFYKQAFQGELEIRSYTHARQILEDWARLKIPPAQVKEYQALIKGYVGATVDDVRVGKDGQYTINGKALAEI